MTFKRCPEEDLFTKENFGRQRAGAQTWSVAD